jgi:anti-sigma factor ChrR (cupin superfamily)
MRDITIYRNLFTAGLDVDQLDLTPYVQPGRAGVDVDWLYTGAQTGPDGAEAYIARFAPGSHGNLHEHLGFELMIVLDGELHNDNGDVYPPGTLIVEQPTSVHQVSSPHGCVAIVIREKGTVPVSATAPAAVAGAVGT